MRGTRRTQVLTLFVGVAMAMFAALAGVASQLATASASTGDVFVFGDNQYGQLGIEANSESLNPSSTPTLLALLDATGAVAQLAAGEEHSLAVTLSGQLYAFGSNKYGQLGSTVHNETEKATSTPTLVTLPGESGAVVQVAAGANFSLAVTSSGQLYAFGSNRYGQLGSKANAETEKANPTPTLVTLPGQSGTVTQIAAGEGHSLAVTSSGQLYAFGSNNFGQLGSEANNEIDGVPNTKANPTPALVKLPEGSGPVATVGAGRHDSLAVTSAGHLYTFGENYFGQLGDEANLEEEAANPTPTLVELPEGRTVILVARGSSAYHTLALDTEEAPAVVTGAATSITADSAVLKASVNPDELTVTSCEFEYGTTEHYGSSEPCSSLPGGGDSPVQVSASAPHLKAETTYFFRIVATNADGTTYGEPGTFETLRNPPAVVTTAPSSLMQTSVVLNATVNPEGGVVSSCSFEYGTTTSYGSSVPCSSLPGAGGESPVAVSQSLGGLGVDTTYHYRIVATNEGGTSDGIDGSFTTLPNTPTVATDAASSVVQTSATLNATVNPNGGEVSGCEFEYGTSTSYGHSVECASLPGSGKTAVDVSASLTGLAANTTYYYRISATNPGGTSDGGDQSFATEPNPPAVSVVTGAASSVTQTAATLNAVVDPNGDNVTACIFEYGTTTEYGSTVPCSSLPGSGTSNVDVSAAVEGLSPETTYYFRVVATNLGGVSSGVDQALTTLPNSPVVLTGMASSVSTRSATLSGTVDPEGTSVRSCRFEYGTTTEYGSSVPCSTSPGAGENPVGVSATLAGLELDTTYHFRLVAKNSGGTSDGGDSEFTTGAVAPAVVTGSASSATQTAATLNATVNPNGTEVSDCHFEYGPSAAYGSSVPCATLPGSGEGPVAVSASVTGLSNGDTYHFRIVATNPGGTSDGDDGRFITGGAPEFGRCIEVAGDTVGTKTVYHGGFKGATCVAASASRTGKFEWYPGVLKGGFKTTLKREGDVKLDTVEGMAVDCRTETGAGEYRGTKEVAGLVFRFTGCEIPGRKATPARICTSSGLAEGELETRTLEGALGWQDRAAKKVALDLYPAGDAGPVLEYGCAGGMATTVDGSLLVPVRVDKMGQTSSFGVKAAKGVQKPDALEGGEQEVLMSSLNGAAAVQAGLTAGSTIASEEAIEINADV